MELEASFLDAGGGEAPPPLLDTAGREVGDGGITPPLPPVSLAGAVRVMVVLLLPLLPTPAMAPSLSLVTSGWLVIDVMATSLHASVGHEHLEIRAHTY